ncbi:hypothetical protein FHS18_004352 [Paenibacillus phyllosphaerae]|uniref:SLH domain-containing protein n=1 Tax=Paenibacillus phyllosphaerae TaxID=274593 RepID=A0A7W5B241_9BACL|nr:S-layer homology domain-containing protein [Paenibacillus phyllosphaerae]MBB3112266.1 hypothetical protein [Paenibacillus phyllosphaerae]
MKKALGLLGAAALLWSHSAAYAANDKLTVAEKYEAFKKAGIFKGYPDGEAHLDASITRAELAVVLSRLLDLQPPAKAEADFVDLEGHWVSKRTISAVASKGVMVGKGNGRFDPDGLVTIQELAVILTRTTGLSPQQTTITDAKVSEWAQGYVAAVVEAGLIDPQQDYTAPATRAFVVDASFMEYETLPLYVGAPHE